jgi:hypothetical protein
VTSTRRLPWGKHSSRNREDHSPSGPWLSPPGRLNPNLRDNVKEMNFLSANRSSNPIWPATQSGSRMCRNGVARLTIALLPSASSGNQAPETGPRRPGRRMPAARRLFWKVEFSPHVYRYEGSSAPVMSPLPPRSVCGSRKSWASTGRRAGRGYLTTSYCKLSDSRFREQVYWVIGLPAWPIVSRDRPQDTAFGPASENPARLSGRI